MKKARKILFIILLIISFLPIVIIFLGGINAYINGFGQQQSPYPTSIYLPKFDNGFIGLANYLKMAIGLYSYSVGFIVDPILLICLFYQVIYFKKIKNI